MAARGPCSCLSAGAQQLTLASGATLTTVRDNLRHASISTTSIYLDDDEVQRTHQIEQIFKRRPSA